MPTLHEALLTYLQVDRSPLTNRQYELVLTQLITAIGPRREVTLVTYEDLVDYFARRRADGLKPTTLAGYFQVTKTFFNWCVRRRYIIGSPVAEIRIRAPARDPSRVKAVPPDELERMVGIARFSSYNGVRNYAMLLFLIDTGCRVGGLVSLTLGNLHLREHWALLTEKGQKPHHALFADKTAKALEAWLKKRPEVGHDYVWTGKAPNYPPLQRGGVAYNVRTIAALVEASHQWGPHSIRHAVGQAYAKAGVPLTITSRKLGHSDTAITLAYYYPEDDEYLVQVSHEHELAPLKNRKKGTLRLVRPEKQPDESDEAADKS